jgi:hypothetical protein
MKVFYRDEQTVHVVDVFSPSARKPAIVVRAWQEVFRHLDRVGCLQAPQRARFPRRARSRLCAWRLQPGCRQRFRNALARGRRLPTLHERLDGGRRAARARAPRVRRFADLRLPPRGLGIRRCLLHVQRSDAGCACGSRRRSGARGDCRLRPALRRRHRRHHRLLESAKLARALHLRAAGVRQCAGRCRVLADLKRVCGRVASEADLVLYQAGADPHRDDPLGGSLSTAEIRRRDEIVFEAARAASVPLAWNLAGGYQEPLQKVVELHVQTMGAALAVQRDSAPA